MNDKEMLDLPIDIFFGAHVIGDQIRVNLLLTIQWHLNDNSMHIVVIV